MSASHITSIVKRPVDPDEYWIKIEQVAEVDNTATLGEVAEVIDALYGTSNCSGDELTDDTVPAIEASDSDEEEKEQLTLELIEEVVKNRFDLRLCGMSASGDYFTQVKVAISKPGESYTLRLTGGVVTKTVAVDEVVTKKIAVESAESVQLDLPITGAGSYGWSDSVVMLGGYGVGPDVVQSGSELSWNGAVSGAVVAEFPTHYDLVDITVFGTDDGEPGECTVIGFYHGMVDEAELNAPDVDDDASEVYRSKYCGAGIFQVPESTDDVVCFENVTYLYKCRCSGQIEYEVREEVVVDCPDGIRCQGGADECRSLMGSRTVLGGYVDCSETDDKLNSPAYYEKLCCDPPAGALPQCATYYTKNKGGQEIDATELADLQALYGELLRVVAVSPADGDCGTTKTVIVPAQQNCCIDVEPLEIDTSMVPDVLPDYSRAVIGVVGGVSPYEWQALSSGLSFNEGGSQRTAVSDGANIWIYSGDICGTVKVRVTDACDQSVVIAMRATEGQWMLAPDMDGCIGVPECEYTAKTRTCVAISGKYRQTQTYWLEGTHEYYEFIYPAGTDISQAAAAAMCGEVVMGHCPGGLEFGHTPGCITGVEMCAPDDCQLRAAKVFALWNETRVHCHAQQSCVNDNYYEEWVC